jgi:hypothetical protein
MMWNITCGKQMTFNDEISNICSFDLGLHTLDQNHVRREQIRLTKVGWKYEELWQGAPDQTIYEYTTETY